MNKKLLMLIITFYMSIISASNAHSRDYIAEKEAFNTLCACTRKLFATNYRFSNQMAEAIKAHIIDGAIPVYYALETNKILLLSDTFNCIHFDNVSDIIACQQLKNFVDRVEEMTFAQRRIALNLID